MERIHFLRIKRRIIFLGLAILASGLLPPASIATPDAEYDLKAAVLVKLLGFVEFKQTPGGAPTIAILGKDPFGSRLPRELEAAYPGGKKARILYFSQLQLLLESKEHFNVVFVALTESGDIDAALTQLPAHGVLTIGDTKDFCRSGGMISLLKSQNRIKFEVNVEMANQAQLKVSSKLLALATIVNTQPRKKND